MGSLVSALGSWVDARHHRGEWLLRIEDIDPERESPEATEAILKSLYAHQLYWDGEVSYQHQRSGRYDNALSELRKQDRLYACTCTRKSLRALDRKDYPGICRNKKHPEANSALRVLIDKGITEFSDLVFGPNSDDVSQSIGDFIVRRKGPLYAYQLAVVVDDAEQQVTRVVRGADLLDNTPRQIVLQSLLGYQSPEYLHLPLVLDREGRKLSKQTGAAPLNDSTPLENLQQAWTALGQSPIDASVTDCDAFLGACIEKWDIGQITK